MRSIYGPGPAHREASYFKRLIHQFSRFFKVWLVITCHPAPPPPKKPQKLETFSEIKKSI